MELSRKMGALLFLSVAAVCLTIGTANAQETTQGTFTLQHTTQWGNHVLPKGNYSCMVQQTDDMRAATVTIGGTSNSSRQIELVGFGHVPEALLNGSNSALVVTHYGDSYAVRGIYLAKRGVEYRFPVHIKAEAVMVKDSKPAPGRQVALRIPIRSASN